MPASKIKLINKIGLILNTAILLLFLLSQFFGFSLVSPAQATGCSISVSWKNSSGGALSGNIYVGDTAKVFAQFTNCNIASNDGNYSNTTYFTILVPRWYGISEDRKVVPVISQPTETRQLDYTFDTDGQFRFKATVDGGSSKFYEETSSPIDVAKKPAGPACTLSLSVSPTPQQVSLSQVLNLAANISVPESQRPFCHGYQLNLKYFHAGSTLIKELPISGSIDTGSMPIVKTIQTKASDLGYKSGDQMSFSASASGTVTTNGPTQNVNIASSAVNVGVDTSAASNFLLSFRLDPDKGTYSPADNELKLYINLDPADAAKLPDNVFIVVKVNGEKIIEKDLNKSKFQTKDGEVENIPIAGKNALNNGDNIISVELFYSSNLTVKVASGTKTLKGSGFAADAKKYACDSTQQPPKCVETTDGSGTDLAACQASCGTNNGKKYSCDQAQNKCVETTDGSGTDLAACSCGNPTIPPFDDKLYNPLPSGDLFTMFLIIAKGFLAGIGIMGVLFIIVGGFEMVIAAGNEEMITKGKKTITWAVIGVIVAGLSFSIVSIVQNLLRANTTLIK